MRVEHLVEKLENLKLIGTNQETSCSFPYFAANYALLGTIRTSDTYSKVTRSNNDKIAR